MTAEAAVLNREAAAIAADSAVTLPFRSGEDDKVYNSANKIFELSAVHPVGIMIHGLGAYGLIPWETIIKMYRHQLGVHEFDTVAEYGSNFIHYLEEFAGEFTSDIQQQYARHVIDSELTRIKVHMKEAAASLSGIGNFPSRAQLRPELFDTIKSRREQLTKATCSDPIDLADADHIIQEIYSDWPAHLESMFAGVTTDEDVVAAASALAVDTLRGRADR